MPLHLSLTPEVENRLHMAAAKTGKPAEQYAAQLIEENLPVPEKNRAAIETLRAWAKEAEEMSDEESAENEAILRAIDDDRLSDRKLFGELLKVKPSAS